MPGRAGHDKLVAKEKSKHVRRNYKSTTYFARSRIKAISFA